MSYPPPIAFEHGLIRVRVVTQRQLKRLAHVKAERDDDAVRAALGAVTAASAKSDVNLMLPILDAVRAYATVGEVIEALAATFGRWSEDPVI